MDKLIYGGSEGKSVTISNDGATIIKLLDIVPPAARILTGIARAQDEEVGDGTTSVVLQRVNFCAWPSLLLRTVSTRGSSSTATGRPALLSLKN